MEREPRFLSIERRRRVAAGTLLRIFPTRMEGDSRPLERTKILADEGYGVALIYNHFSNSDHLRAIAAALPTVPTMAQKRLGSPVALHQDRLDLRALRRFARGELMYIVTGHTKKMAAEGDFQLTKSEEERRKAYREYIATARDILSDGGTILVAPQSRRRPVLGEPLENPPIYNMLSGYDNDKVVFLFAGLGIPGETDYGSGDEVRDNIKGVNVRKLYTVRFGGPLTRDELLERCGGDESKIDNVIFDELRAVVPAAYNEKPSET